VERGLACLQRTWRGFFCYYAQRAAAVESPFCERTIYNLVIDLFMCLHRLSLDATGHVWEPNVFMALCLISQAIFPHCIRRQWRSNQYATVGFLKNYIRLINVRSADICVTALLILQDDTRSVSTFHTSDLFTAAWLFTAYSKCSA